MQVVIASSNRGKIEEFKKIFNDIISYKDLFDIEIEENCNSFKENAIIKAKAINEKLKNINFKDYIVISDDSGISVEALNNRPGIYSARYAGGDKENNQKIIKELKEKNLDSSKAFYTACICLIYKDKVYTTFGFLRGKVICEERGSNGFGYDPLFIPNGFDKTLGELDYSIKKSLSHRQKAIDIMKYQMKALGLIDVE